MLTGEPEQRLEGCYGRAAPIESKDELVEIVGEMLPAHAAVSASQPRLEMRENAMDPRGTGLRPPSALPASWVGGHSHAACAGVARPAVRPHDAGGRHGGFDKADQRRSGHVRYHAEPEAASARPRSSTAATTIDL